MTKPRSIEDLAALDSKAEAAERTRVYAEYQARLRAEEIDFLAREQYNADLQKLVNLSFAKLNTDYELQRSEIDRKAKIQFSVTKNTQRIRILQSQQDIIQLALTETRKKLQEFRATPQYRDVLSGIIQQTISVLQEKAIVISVVPADLDLAEQIVRTLAGKVNVTATVDRENPLNPSRIGGAVVGNVAGTIRVDNSFEGRLELAVEQALPEIGALLKP
jgi:vacuolar-type H+-ATPase subunit E/Vma4